MPYIEPGARVVIDPKVEALDSAILTEGDLNYVVTRLALRFARRKGLKYAVLNTVVGVFECAKLEFYRRLVACYEADKIYINGDVPEYQEVP